MTADPFGDPFKDLILVLPPLGGLPVDEWEARVAGYLGYCLDGGILADYITMEGLLMVAAYKSYPEFWKHVALDPKVMSKLKQTSEKIQVLIKYFLHVRVRDGDKVQIDWSQPWLPELTEEDKLAGVKKALRPDQDLPPQLKPMLFQLDKQRELVDISYNVQVMTRLIQSGYLRYQICTLVMVVQMGFLSENHTREADRGRGTACWSCLLSIVCKAAAKTLRKFVKVPKEEKKPVVVVPAGAEGEGEPPDEMVSALDALPKKAMPLEQWLVSKEAEMKEVFAQKLARIAAGHMHIDRDDRYLTETRLNVCAENL